VTRTQRCAAFGARRSQGAAPSPTPQRRRLPAYLAVVATVAVLALAPAKVAAQTLPGFQHRPPRALARRQSEDAAALSPSGSAGAPGARAGKIHGALAHRRDAGLRQSDRVRAPATPALILRTGPTQAPSAGPCEGRRRRGNLGDHIRAAADAGARAAEKPPARPPKPPPDVHPAKAAARQGVTLPRRPTRRPLATRRPRCIPWRRQPARRRCADTAARGGLPRRRRRRRPAYRPPTPCRSAPRGSGCCRSPGSTLMRRSACARARPAVSRGRILGRLRHQSDHLPGGTGSDYFVVAPETAGAIRLVAPFAHRQH